MSDYYGWANRETWAMNLWLSNDEGLYRALTAALADADEEPGQVIATFWEELTVNVEAEDADAVWFIKTILPMILDVGSVWRVDFDEIAANWLDK